MYARLSDNTLLFLRAIRADDKALLADSHAHLSDESVVKRYLGPKPSLSPTELRYLTEVDGYDHHAIVAMPDDGEDRIVGVARFVRLQDDPHSAEVAITVCDELQGHGLGSLLARLIADAARERDIDRLTASISSQNAPALSLMRQIDDRLRSEPVGSSVTEIVATLTPGAADGEPDRLHHAA